MTQLCRKELNRVKFVSNYVNNAEIVKKKLLNRPFSIAMMGTVNDGNVFFFVQ